MNEQTDIEQVLERWFDEGPTRMPDRVAGVVADRIDRERQRRQWRLPWRQRTVNLPIKLGAAVLAVAMIAILGYNLLPGTSRVGGPVAPLPTPTASPSPRPSPTPAATRWWSGWDTCGACAGYLVAGPTTSRAFKPGVTVTVPDGWINNYDGADGYGLLPDTDANRKNQLDGSPTLHDLTIVRNVALGSLDCTNAREPGIGTTSRDIVDALERRKGLQTSKPTAVSVGGLSGYQIDIALDDAWTTPCPGDDTPQVALVTFQAPGQGHFGAVPGNRFRFILLDVPATSGGGTLLIDVFAAQSDAFARHLAAAMPIVGSFEFAVGGPSASPS